MAHDFSHVNRREKRAWKKSSMKFMLRCDAVGVSLYCLLTSGGVFQWRRASAWWTFIFRWMRNLCGNQLGCVLLKVTSTVFDFKWIFHPLSAHKNLCRLLFVDSLLCFVNARIMSVLLIIIHFSVRQSLFCSIKIYWKTCEKRSA